MIREGDLKFRLTAKVRDLHGVGLHCQLESRVSRRLRIQHDWIEGESLRDIFNSAKGGRSHIHEFPLLLKEVERFHEDPQEILHGDISPANIIRTKTNANRISYSLIDWSELSSAAYEANLKFRPKFRAKPAYLSPERARTGVNSIQSEVFALGVILYEWLTSETIVDNSTSGYLTLLDSSEVYFNSEMVSLEYAKILSKCLAFDPEARFGSVREFRLAIENFSSI